MKSSSPCGSLRLPLHFLLLIVLSAFSASCSVEQTLHINPDLSGTMESRGRSLSFAAVALEDLAFLGGYDSAGDLYDVSMDGINGVMALRHGVSSFTLERRGDHGWTSTAAFDEVSALWGPDSADGIITLTQRGSAVTMKVTMNRDNSQALEEMVPMLKDPALSLFNPAGIGDMDEESYIRDILGFTFGEDNVDDIRGSTVVLTVNLPGPITEISGGEMEGSRSARFEAPLTAILVPEVPVTWSVTWRNP